MKKEDISTRQKKSNSNIYLITLIACLFIIISIDISINSSKWSPLYNKLHLQLTKQFSSTIPTQQHKIYIHQIPDNLKHCLQSIPCPVCDNLKKIPNYTEDIKEASLFIIPLYALFKFNSDCKLNLIY